MSAGIYKITNPKGAIYIGQSLNVELRIKRYSEEQQVKSQILLLRSIKKYGLENHTIEIIESGNFTKDELNRLEKAYIKSNKSFRKINTLGLNLTTGGDSYEFSEETKLKMSLTRKRKIQEGQYNSKISIENVKQIKIMLNKHIKQVDIAKEFGVSKNLITEIKKGRAWSTVNI